MVFLECTKQIFNEKSKNWPKRNSFMPRHLKKWYSMFVKKKSQMGPTLLRCEYEIHLSEWGVGWGVKTTVSPGQA